LWISPWVTVVFIAVVGFLSICAAVQQFLGIPLGSRPAPTYVYVVLAAVFTAIYVSFARLEVDINAERVSVRYGLVNKAVPMSSVTSCEPTRSRFSVYGGFGIRIGTDRSLAFTNSFGDAVRLERAEGMPLVFSTRRQVEVVSLIRSLRAGAPGKAS
ncbi:hypothetical protein MUO93_08270, partial [Candidatus Bathyarchaeota archaeon]|nr:hypothetical protein [Candidatus Bathyarchaeota archaeon]